jgi:sarcosine oxidase
VIIMETGNHCYDYIVVGLGTAGSATCLELARRRVSVLGIDAHRPPHRLGSHHGASRSIRRAYLEGSAYVPMAMRSWQLWRKLEKDATIDLLVTTGNLTIGPPYSPAVAGFLASARKYQIEHEQLTARQVMERFPCFTMPEDFVAGLEVEAGIIFPETAITTILTQAHQSGATLHFNEQVESWQETAGGVIVQTTQGRYEAGRVLVSAGAWTGKLLGLAEPLLRPHRVVVHWLEEPDARFHLGRLPVSFWQIPVGNDAQTNDPYREFYILPTIPPDSRLKVAFHNGLEPCDPDVLRRDVLTGEDDAIRDVLGYFCPELQHHPIRSEVCLYIMTPDTHFYLGKRPGSKNVFGVALAGHGFKFAPVLGEILADLLTDTPPRFDLTLFSPARF